MMSLERITGILTKENVPFKLHEHGVVLTMRDVSERLGFAPESSLKTLVFRIRKLDWVLAVIAGGERVDYARLAYCLGVSRADLSTPSVEEIESQLETRIGGISPIPTKKNIIVIFDAKIAKMSRVYCGIGRNDCSLEIDALDLIRVANASLCAFARNRPE
jgi:Cys-tRNA(Pro)/Cys-tRNA(Cys) deacylase